MENPGAAIARLLGAGPLGPVRRTPRETWFVADARGPGRKDRALARFRDGMRGFRMAGVYLDELVQPLPCLACYGRGWTVEARRRLSAFGPIAESVLAACPSCSGTGQR